MSTRTDGLEKLKQELHRSGVDILPRKNKSQGDFLVADANANQSRTIPCKVYVSQLPRLSLHKKLVGIDRLIAIYVWIGSGNDRVIFHAIPAEQVKQIFEDRGHAKSSSWRHAGYYSHNNPPQITLDMMARFRANRKNWSSLLFNHS